MESVNILITAPIGQEYLERITAISPSVTLWGAGQA